MNHSHCAVNLEDVCNRFFDNDALYAGSNNRDVLALANMLGFPVVRMISKSRARPRGSRSNWLVRNHTGITQ